MYISKYMEIKHRRVTFLSGRDVYSMDSDESPYRGVDRPVEIRGIARVLEFLNSGKEYTDINIADTIQRNSHDDVDLLEALKYSIKFLTQKNNLFETKQMQSQNARVSVGDESYTLDDRWVIEKAIARLLRVYEHVFQWSCGTHQSPIKING